MSYKTTTQARSLPLGYGARVIDAIERDIKGKSAVMKKAILSRERQRNNVRRRMMTSAKDKQTLDLIDRYIGLLDGSYKPKKASPTTRSAGSKGKVITFNSLDINRRNTAEIVREIKKARSINEIRSKSAVTTEDRKVYERANSELAEKEKLFSSFLGVQYATRVKPEKDALLIGKSATK